MSSTLRNAEDQDDKQSNNFAIGFGWVRNMSLTLWEQHKLRICGRSAQENIWS